MVAVASELRRQNPADQAEERCWVLHCLLGEILAASGIAERPEDQLLQVGRQLVWDALWATCAWAISTTSCHLIPVD
jgi:hypothetical protein